MRKKEESLKFVSSANIIEFEKKMRKKKSFQISLVILLSIKKREKKITNKKSFSLDGCIYIVINFFFSYILFRAIF